MGAPRNPAGTFPVYAGGTDLGTGLGHTGGEFAEVVAHSDIRPEYLPDLLKLARNSISPADAVEMVVKQVMAMNTGQNLYAAAGGIPEQFHALVAAAGDSLGPEKLVDLLAHGLITYPRLNRALGMSRVNPDFYYAYIDPATQGAGPVHAKWLGPYEIGSAIAAGDVDAATGLQWLLDQGYAEAQAEAFTTSKATTVVAKVKEDTAGQVLKLYAAQLYTEAETTAALGQLGYTSAAIAVLEEQAQATAMIAAHNSGRVPGAGRLPGGRDNPGPGHDRPASPRRAGGGRHRLPDRLGRGAGDAHQAPSAAQMGKLCEKGKITVQVAQAKWMAMGYSSNDAALLVILYPPPNPVVPGAGTAAVTG